MHVKGEKISHGLLLGGVMYKWGWSMYDNLTSRTYMMFIIWSILEKYVEDWENDLGTGDVLSI